MESTVKVHDVLQAMEDDAAVVGARKPSLDDVKMDLLVALYELPRSLGS